MAVTYISAIAFISSPVMVHQQGTKNFWALASCALTALPCTMFVLPLLFRLQPSNIFEVKKHLSENFIKLNLTSSIFQNIPIPFK